MAASEKAVGATGPDAERKRSATVGADMRAAAKALLAEGALRQLPTNLFARPGAAPAAAAPTPAAAADADKSRRGSESEDDGQSVSSTTAVDGATETRPASPGAGG